MAETVNIQFALFYHLFHGVITIEPPATVHNLRIIIFQGDFVAVNRPGVIIIKLFDFPLQVCFNPLPASFRNVFPIKLLPYSFQRNGDDAKKARIPRATERRGGDGCTTMLIEVDWQSNILFQERIPEVSNSPLEYLVDFEIRMKVFFGLIVAMCCIQCPQMVEFLSGVEGILIVVDVDTLVSTKKS